MRASGWADPLLVVPPPAGLDGWLSAGIAVRLQAPAAFPSAASSRFPAGVASAIVVTSHGRFGLQDSAKFNAFPAAFASGPSTRPVAVGHDGPLVSVGVMVRPAAAAALLGPLDGLVNQAVAADDLFGATWQPVQRAMQASEPEAALQALFDFVESRARNSGRVAALRDALALQQASLLGVTEAAQRCGCSPRQFQRRFVAAFGIPPKRFHRLARAEVAMRIALAAGRCDADLALQLGYFDQSHLGRDLRELAGLTPAEVARMPAQGDPAWWPLRVGAAYPGHGVRADFGAPQASLFS